MTGSGAVPALLLRAAQAHVDRWLAGEAAERPPLGRLAGLRVRPDVAYCRAVAAAYQAAPRFDPAPQLQNRYQTLKLYTLRAYHAAVAAGVVVEPWRRPGQPYRDSRDLRARVGRTGRLAVFLTAAGHGPGGDAAPHPLREPSGVRAGGVEFAHNDLFRAVHDLFGHVMFGHGFGPAGEFLAAYVQMQLYPREVWPVLFTEQVGQICWFFHGPHADEPPHRRPYPEQKVFACPDRFLDAFAGMFRLEEDPG
ncbi:MAG TPA: crotonobetainyl-CoA--carnitine CoA-transferase [Thermomonospora sp.]|nr:crotonobetainyl-CoA--carnitine CoA-transferase [Thermomonospora sp.]